MAVRPKKEKRRPVLDSAQFLDVAEGDSDAAPKENPCNHFRLLPTSVKVLVSLVPTVVTAAIITTAISEAIRPYSMAVAPELSLANFFNRLCIKVTPFSGPRPLDRASCGMRDIYDLRTCSIS